MNRNCNFEKLVSFKPCRLVYGGTDAPKPPEHGVEGAATEAPKTPEEKRQQLADGIQKIEQKVAALTKQIDERSKDTTFQGVLSARKLDVGAALKDIAAKVAAIKANLDKPDTDKHAATLDEIQKALAPLSDAVETSDILKDLNKADELDEFNTAMKVKFPKDEAGRAKAFKEAKAEKSESTAEIGKEFKLKESTNLFDNIGKKEGRIVGVLTEDTTVKIIDKKMM